MACINTCLVGAGFIGSSVLTMISCSNGKKFKDFNNTLDAEQQQTYSKIKNERMSIYIQGLFIGIALSMLVLSMTKIDKSSKVCLFIVISMGFNMIYYHLLIWSKIVFYGLKIWRKWEKLLLMIFP